MRVTTKIAGQFPRFFPDLFQVFPEYGNVHLWYLDERLQTPTISGVKRVCLCVCVFVIYIYVPFMDSI